MLILGNLARTWWVFALLICLIPAVVHAEEPQEQISISGEWIAVYTGRSLGKVQGRATISPDETSAKVEYTHPVSGKKFKLFSTSFRRNGNKITIVFEGKQPGSEHKDGQGFPQHDLIVPENTNNFDVTVRKNKVTANLNPRKESDLDKVTLEIVLDGREKLYGFWLYNADPVTERDRLGYGRVGDFLKLDDGTFLQHGGETWTRPKPFIYGAFALENQSGFNHYTKKPFYPHPFQGNERDNRYAFRTLFIFGENLPQDRSSPVIFKSDSEYITYRNVKFPGDASRLPDDLNPFSEDKRKLLKRFLSAKEQVVFQEGDSIVTEVKLKEEGLPPDEQEVIQECDFIVAEVKLKEGVTPGLQSFSMNGAEAAWVLQFGDHKAHISFVRKIDPVLPTSQFEIWVNAKTGEEIRLVGHSEDLEEPYKYKQTVYYEYEHIHDVFIPEEIRVEVRTDLVLDVDKINITFGHNGELKKLGSGPLIPAHRTKDDPRVFLTDPILLTKASGGDKLIYYPGPHYEVAAKNGDYLLAEIADPGLIPAVPLPARGNIHTSPASTKEGHYSFLWKDYLLQAAACWDINITNWDRENDEFVDDISETLFLEDKWDLISFFSTPGGHLLFKKVFGTKLKTNFELGDHAAMLLMRQTFIDQIEKTIIRFKTDSKSNNKNLFAFRHYIDPFRWNAIDHPITQSTLNRISPFSTFNVISPSGYATRKSFFSMEVTGPDGNKIPFWKTFELTDDIQDPKDVPRWVYDATREAINEYIRILEKSKAYAKGIEAKELEDLVKLTGNSFDAIRHLIIPRLMKLETEFVETRPNLWSPAPLNNYGTGGDFPTYQPSGPRWTLNWTPDNSARLRVTDIENKFLQVKFHQDISDEDTQNLIIATALLTLPVCIGGGPYIAFACSFSEVAFESYFALDKYSESQAEIEFVRGTIDVLGYGRYKKAKAEEYDYLDLTLRVATIIGFEMAAGPLIETIAKSIAFEAKKAFKWFRKGIRNIRAQRGRVLLSKYDFDVEKLPSNLGQRNYRNIIAYATKAKMLRKANRILDDNQTKILSQLDILTEKAIKRPKWARNLDDVTNNALKDLYSRKDIAKLMKSSENKVIELLRKGGRDRQEALNVLRFRPNRTWEQFKRQLDARLEIKTEAKDPIKFFKQTDPGDAVGRKAHKLLDDAHWKYELKDVSGDVPGSKSVKLSDPDGGRTEVVRAFDKDTGTFTMVRAERVGDRSKFDFDLPANLTKKGTPTLIFANLRLMNEFKIGFAGAKGNQLKMVVMKNVTNKRTDIQLVWFRNTYHPAKSFKELNEAGLLGDFLRHTRSVQYAESIINLAGYRIKSVKLDDLAELPSAIGEDLSCFKVLSDAETAEQYLRRYGVSKKENGPGMFDILIEVEPKRSVQDGFETQNTIVKWEPGSPPKARPRNKDPGSARSPDDAVPTSESTHSTSQGNQGQTPDTRDNDILRELANNPPVRIRAKPGRIDSPSKLPLNSKDQLPLQEYVDRRLEWRNKPRAEREEYDAKLRSAIDEAAAMGDKWAKRLQKYLDERKIDYAYEPGIKHKGLAPGNDLLLVNPYLCNSPDEAASSLIHEFAHSYKAKSKEGDRLIGEYNELRAFLAEAKFNRHLKKARRFNGKEFDDTALKEVDVLMNIDALPTQVKELNNILGVDSLPSDPKKLKEMVDLLPKEKAEKLKELLVLILYK